MITRDDIRELANFQSPEGYAITFYYQPSTPLNKSHKEEAILVKDMIRGALRDAEKRGKNGSTRSDLERIGSMVDPLHGNGRQGQGHFRLRPDRLLARVRRTRAAAEAEDRYQPPLSSQAAGCRSRRRAASLHPAGRPHQGARLRADE